MPDFLLDSSWKIGGILDSSAGETLVFSSTGPLTSPGVASAGIFLPKVFALKLEEEWNPLGLKTRKPFLKIGIEPLMVDISTRFLPRCWNRGNGIQRIQRLYGLKAVSNGSVELSCNFEYAAKSSIQ
jgi:hypothetical protein